MNEGTKLVAECEHAKIQMKGRETLFIKKEMEAHVTFKIQVPSMVRQDEISIIFSLIADNKSVAQQMTIILRLQQSKYKSDLEAQVQNRPSQQIQAPPQAPQV